MRAVIQRVSEASVTANGEVRGAIQRGLLVYLGVGAVDTEADADYLADKVRHLRIFPDADDKMNLDVSEAGGAILVVSAFTVHADARRGRRPSFEMAAAPDSARALYERFCQKLEQTGLAVARGSFGDYMHVHAINAGPVCILLDSHRAF